MTHAPPNGSSFRQYSVPLCSCLREGSGPCRSQNSLTCTPPRFSGDEMSELMHDDQHAEGEDCQNDLQQSGSSFRSAEHDLARGFVRRQNVVQRDVLLVRNGIECVCNALCDVGKNRSYRSKNRPTAASFAPLSTAPRSPLRRAAYFARFSAGNASVGCIERRFAISASDMRGTLHGTLRARQRQLDRQAHIRRPSCAITASRKLHRRVHDTLRGGRQFDIPPAADHTATWLRSAQTLVHHGRQSRS